MATSHHFWTSAVTVYFSLCHRSKVVHAPHKWLDINLSDGAEFQDSEQNGVVKGSKADVSKFHR